MQTHYTQGRTCMETMFSCIRLNIPTACPPRTDVPVNRPFSTASTGDGLLFGFEFGQVCDLPNDVESDSILFLHPLHQP